MLSQCKGLTEALRKTANQSSSLFTVYSQETETCSTITYILEILSIGKDIHKAALQPRWKGPYQVLLTNLCATKPNGIDSWIHVSHLKKAPTPAWHSDPIGELKLKISKEQKQMHLNPQVSQDSGPGQCNPIFPTRQFVILFATLLLNHFVGGTLLSTFLSSICNI